MIRSDQLVALVGSDSRAYRLGDLAGADLGGRKVLAWDMDTWFHIYSDVDVNSQYPVDLVTVRYCKHGEKNQPKSDYWLSEMNRSIQVTPEHELLLANGQWRSAKDLRAGDMLQHFCGNGHEAIVEDVALGASGESCKVLVPKYQSIICGGVIAAARG